MFDMVERLKKEEFDKEIINILIQNKGKISCSDVWLDSVLVCLLKDSMLWHLLFQNDFQTKFAVMVANNLRALVLVPQVYTLEWIRADDISTGLV